MRASKTLVTTCLAILAIFFAVTPLVFAQAQEKKYTGLLIRTPAEYRGFTFEFYMNRGETRCDSFIAQHDFESEAEERKFFTMTSDLIIDPQSRQPNFPANALELNHRYSLAKWVAVELDEVTLPYWGYEQDMDFCVTVPDDASSGSHYAVILLSNITKEEYLQGVTSSDTGTQVATRSGVNLIVTVAGDVTSDFGISSFSARDIDLNTGLFGNIFEWAPINFVTDLNNGGNTFIKPAGNITVHQGDITAPLATLVFNPTANRILPESSYSFKDEWNDSLFFLKRMSAEVIQAGTGSQNTVFSNQLQVDTNKLSSLRLGRYFATLQVTYYDINGDFQRLADYTIEFWIIPWKLLLALTILISLMLWLWRKNRVRKRHR